MPFPLGRRCVESLLEVFFEGELGMIFGRKSTIISRVKIVLGGTSELKTAASLQASFASPGLGCEKPFIQ
ncbi:MAG: hypothetical protein ABF381_14810 [Akkermansiaceae bacterium]|jgi:hypothetical protein